MSIEKALRGIAIAGVFALPLIVFIVSASMFFPYITGKNFTFRIIVEIIFGAWFMLALLDARYRPRWNALLVAIVAFVGIVALADVFGANPLKSFWSNFERMEGLVTLLHLLAYFVVAGTVLATERMWLWFWRVSLGVSAIVSFQALAQFAATEKTRLDATLGNPIYLAIYAVFHIFIALILLVRRGAVRVEQICYLLMLPLLATTLLLTATRGATLGLVIGLGFATLGVALFSKVNGNVRRIAAAGLLLIVVFASGVFLARDTQFIKESRFSRLANISITDSTVFARTLVWNTAWQGVKERPLLGWGQENFNLVFNEHYDPRMYAQETWFDRTHNIIFDWLIAAGVLGLLAYLSMYLAALWLLYKTTALTVVQKWLVFGLFAAYGFHNLTVFDNIISYLFFFSVLAWLYALSRTEEQKQETRQPWTLPEGYGLPSLGVVTVLAIALVWVVNISPMKTAHDIIGALRGVSLAQRSAQQGNEGAVREYMQQALQAMNRAQERGTLGTQEARERLTGTTQGFANAQWLPDDIKQTWYAEAERGMRAQQEIAPDDARFPFLLGIMQISYGKLAAAETSLLRALELSPDKQVVLLQLVLVENELHGPAAALPYARQAFEAEPSYNQARILYAVELLYNDRGEEAVALLDEDPVAVFDGRALRALALKGYFDDAHRLWEEGLAGRQFATFEKKRDAIFLLAQAYVGIGDHAHALAEVNYIAEHYPDMQALARQALGELEKMARGEK